MTAAPILRRSLADGGRALLGWAIGVVAVLALYLPIYPSLGGDAQLQQLIDSLPSELVNALGYDDIGSGAGYTQASFFGLLGLVLLVIAATAWGSDAIAGAEEHGRLELALAHGVTRVGYALASAASILVRLVVLGAVAFGTILAMNGPAELGLEPVNVLAAVIAIVLLGFLSGSFALAAGALSGRRSIATLAGAGIAVVGYAMNALANQSEELTGLRDWSPYGWAYGGEPLANGFDVPGLLLLGGVAAVAVAVAVVALDRRDIG